MIALQPLMVRSRRESAISLKLSTWRIRHLTTLYKVIKGIPMVIWTKIQTTSPERLMLHQTTIESNYQDSSSAPSRIQVVTKEQKSRNWSIKFKRNHISDLWHLTSLQILLNQFRSGKRICKEKGIVPWTWTRLQISISNPRSQAMIHAKNRNPLDCQTLTQHLQVEANQAIKGERCPQKRGLTVACNRGMTVEVETTRSSEHQLLVRWRLQSQLPNQLKDHKRRKSSITALPSSHSLQRLDTVRRTPTRSTKTHTLSFHILVNIEELISSLFAMVMASLEKKYLISSRHSSDITSNRASRTLSIKQRLPKGSLTQQKSKNSWIKVSSKCRTLSSVIQRSTFDSLDRLASPSL